VFGFLGRLRREVVLGAAIAALGVIFAAALYRVERAALIERSEGDSRRLLGLVADDGLAIFQPARDVFLAMQDAGIADMSPTDGLNAFFAVTTGSVRRITQLSSAYVGFADGGFWQSRGEPPSFMVGHKDLPASVDRTVRRRIVEMAGRMTAIWSVFDLTAKLWLDVDEPAATYDPRVRPWYRAGVASPGTHWSAPYRNPTGGEWTITMSEALSNRSGAPWGVVGVDFYLGRLDALLEEWSTRRLSDGAWIGVIDNSGTTVARALRGTSPELEGRILGLFKENRERLARFDLDGREYFGATAPLGASINLPLALVIAQPADAILGPAVATLERNLLLLLAVLAVLVAVAVYAIKMREEIKARKTAEAGLIEAHAEAQAARVVAEEATKAKSSFLAMMSHEIRTPMNGVMSMAELLDQTELTDDQRSMSATIRSSAASLLTIINDILDFSKIEAGRLEIEKVPFSLIETIEGVGELLIPRAEDKAIGLIIDLDPAIPEGLIGDPTRLRQVALNLAGNAVKFTDRGGVEIVVRPVAGAPEGGSRLRFEIRDTGVGLTPEQRAKLFQPFQQADTSTSRKFGGTGLGLSISLKLVEMMGGTIGVESEFGKGSTFWFEIPFGVTSPAAERPPVDIADARVVCVDVAGRLRDVVTSLFAAAGIDGAVFLESDNFDHRALASRGENGILVMAALRDSATALAIARQLRADAAVAGWKPVLITSRALASTLAEADRSGFFASLTVPLRRHRLWRVMAAALGRASLDQRSGVTDSDIGWAPPPLEEALAAGVAILVAEDNPTNQLVIARLLKQRGYAHEIADNGALALKALEGRNFGLLVTDFHMPEMDGFQLTAAVRAREAEKGLPRLPVVALTADALPGTEEQCLKAGMDGYLTKPIDSKLLTAILAKWLPAAKDFRRRPEVKATAAPKKAEPEIDPAIFELDRVKEMFGDWTSEAKDFVNSFLEGAPDMIARVETALAAADAKAAREAAHALKGASRSLGAARLGQLASDLQDMLDAGDLETAALLQSMLAPTLDELIIATKPIR